jgi:hypothetical protein
MVYVTDASSSPLAQWIPEYLGNGKWAFIADTGKYLARCQDCITGGSTSTSNFAFVYADSSADPKAQWTVTWRFPDGKVSLQADSGKYLTRCTDCGKSTAKDTASVSDSTVTPRSTWTIVKFDNKVSFKSDSGNYLTRCNGCWSGWSKYSDSATVHASNYLAPWAQFNPVWLNNGKWALQSDNGLYLARCPRCRTNIIIDFCFMYVTDPFT